MSRENVEIVERVLGALRHAIDSYSTDPQALVGAIESAGLPADLQEALLLLDPKAEWHPPPEDPDTTARIGPEAILAYLMGWLDAWEYWRVEPEALLDAGEKVVVLAQSTGKGKASGVELAPFRSAHVVMLAEGRIIRVQGFYDRDEALAAAGLRA
jgi:ketosteroid isomerase-like protein